MIIEKGLKNKLYKVKQDMRIKNKLIQKLNNLGPKRDNIKY